MIGKGERKKRNRGEIERDGQWMIAKGMKGIERKYAVKMQKR